MGEEAIKEQRLAMEEGRLYYSGKELDMAVKQLYVIDNTLPVYSLDSRNFYDKEMAHKNIPCNLSTNARIEFVAQGGKQLCNKADVLHCVNNYKRLLSSEQKVSAKRSKIQTTNKSQTDGCWAD